DHAMVPGSTLITSMREAIPLHWHRAASDCHHCNMKRSRNKTYLLKNTESGEVKQVGRTCLKDFLGSRDPEALGDVMELAYQMIRSASQEEEIDYAEAARLGGMPLERFLAIVAMAINEQNGYVSYSRAEIEHIVPTIALVKDMIEKNKVPDQTEREM